MFCASPMNFKKMKPEREKNNELTKIKRKESCHPLWYLLGGMLLQ